MASTYLQRTISSSGSTTKGTLSVWVKKCSIGSIYPRIWTSYVSSNEWIEVYFDNSDRLATYCQVSGSTKFHFVTTRKFRDTNGFYHIVVAFDSTQATASNRVKMYVNGVQETAFDTNTNNTSQNDDLKFNKSSNTDVIGRYVSGSNNYFDGQISHLHWIDGTAYTPSTFGSTDATTGEWKINTSPTLTMGTNGFTILKDGNTITDQSANSNNFTVGGGTLTKTEDCPSNVFATFNVLQNRQGNSFSYGNNKVDIPQAKYFGAASTLGMYSGKYYCEIKLTGGGTDGSGNYKSFIGISGNPSEQDRNNRYLGQDSYSYGYNNDGGNVDNNASSTSYGNSYTNGDIVGIALDLDNNKLYFSKNGTWQNSGVPTSGSTGTGAVSIGTSPTGFWFFGCSSSSTNYTTNHSANFGNGYFQSTAVSSAGSNASNNGIFEYDVPSGYTALSTKGLNT